MYGLSKLNLISLVKTELEIKASILHKKEIREKTGELEKKNRILI